MSQKVNHIRPDGSISKMPGWFSWRHQTNAEHIAANVGRNRVATRARKRKEAEERNAALPADSPRRRRNRVSERAA